MNEKTVTPQPILLDFYSKRDVRVVGPQQDRFVTTEKRAAMVCKLFDDIESFGATFKAFLIHLNLWCGAHQKDVASCYVSVGVEGITSFVVLRGAGYRFDLDAAITTLDLEVAKRFPVIIGDVLQLPEQAKDDLASFFDPSEAIQIWPVNTDIN